MPYPPTSNPYINSAPCEEVLSAKTFDLKKLNLKNDYKLCIVPTFTQIVANTAPSKAVIPEVINYLRYTAAIRALEHNCKFIHQAMRSRQEDLTALTSLTFDYKNGRENSGIRSSGRRFPLSASGFYLSSLNILEESKQIIQFFEDMLLKDKLSQVIPDFNKKMASVTKFKNQYIEYADKLIAAISQNRNIFNNFIDCISTSSKTDIQSEKINISK